jgi:hypothetical protein
MYTILAGRPRWLVCAGAAFRAADPVRVEGLLRVALNVFGMLASIAQEVLMLPDASNAEVLADCG